MLRNTESEIRELSDACLGYLIGAPDELARFMDYAGYDGAALRAAVDSRALAVGLIDYFAHNETALLAMSANAGIGVERFTRAWQRLNPDG